MTYLLDPDAVLDYAVAWRSSPPAPSWLDSNEVITAYTVTATPGVTVDGATETDGVVTVWLSHGVDGANATVTVHITTDAGRKDDRSFQVLVRQR